MRWRNLIVLGAVPLAIACDDSPGEGVCPMAATSDDASLSASSGAASPASTSNALDGASAGDGGSAGDDGDAQALPNPRWILRDADGKALNALVQPRCWAGPPCPDPDFSFESPTYPCVRVIHMNGLNVNIDYEVATGLLGENCGLGVLIGAGAFEQPDCSGVEYAEVGQSIGEWYWSDARRITLREGQLFYPSTAGGPVHLEPAYQLIASNPPDPSSVTCEAGPGMDVYPLVPVPDEIVNLLDNPPYTIEPAY